MFDGAAFHGIHGARNSTGLCIANHSSSSDLFAADFILWYATEEKFHTNSIERLAILQCALYCVHQYVAEVILQAVTVRKLFQH